MSLKNFLFSCFRSPDEKLSTSDTGLTSSQVTHKDICTRDNVGLENLTKGIRESDNINVCMPFVI